MDITISYRGGKHSKCNRFITSINHKSKAKHSFLPIQNKKQNFCAIHNIKKKNLLVFYILFCINLLFFIQPLKINTCNNNNTGWVKKSLAKNLKKKTNNYKNKL